MCGHSGFRIGLAVLSVQSDRWLRYKHGIGNGDDWPPITNLRITAGENSEGTVNGSFRFAPGDPHALTE